MVTSLLHVMFAPTMTTARTLRQRRYHRTCRRKVAFITHGRYFCKHCDLEVSSSETAESPPSR